MLQFPGHPTINMLVHHQQHVAATCPPLVPAISEMHVLPMPLGAPFKCDSDNLLILFEM